MRLLVRAGLLAVGALAFCVAVSTAASADVVEPSSAYQPASTGLVGSGADQGADQGTSGEGNQISPPQAAQPPIVKTPPAEPKAAPVEQVAPATPAPEHQVQPVPAHVKRQNAQTSRMVEGSTLDRAIRPFRIGFERIGSYLEDAVSACQVAAGSGAGGPVLVLAVLGMAAALNRRRVLWTRSTADEDVPELLLATEVIAPG